MDDSASLRRCICGHMRYAHFHIRDRECAIKGCPCLKMTLAPAQRRRSIIPKISPLDMTDPRLFDIV